MPPKTAKKKKQSNNKTKKIKPNRKQFMVDGKSFKLNDNSSKVRIELTDSEQIIKFKEELWPDEANKLWDELKSKNLIKYGAMKLKKKGKINKSKTKLKIKKVKVVKVPTKKSPTNKSPTKTPSIEEELIELDEKFDESKTNTDLEQSCIDLITSLKDNVKNLTLENKKFQKLLKCVEQKNREKIIEGKINTNLIYPHLDDPNFSKNIALKKEFNDVKIEKKTREEIDNLEEETTKLCDTTIDFELQPHQMFVRNFLSFQTPYNGLLLFHGLGTGKTCSSIQVCEDMRTYYNQIGIKKKIIIVASPVVQENYKLQLFDERKLKLINGLWNIKSCTGNKFINEVNPMNMKGLTKTKIIRQIDKIIRQSYEFMGYTEFANKINKLVKNSKGNTKEPEKAKKRKISAIKREFSDRLLVIDEVHNVRSAVKKGKVRRTIQNLKELVMYSQNMKLLLLTATPMFNNYSEIVWLANLLNLNDNRFPINISDIFDNKGNFLIEDGKEIGKNLLIQKLTGYVSYVSGENPFSFPYRIWPSEYNNPHSLKKLLRGNDWNYPNKQINNLEIDNPIEYLDLVITTLHEEQNKAYNYIIKKSKEKYPQLNEPKSGIQYTVIDSPEQALNIVYPHKDLEQGNIDYKGLIGKTGLKRIMHYDKDTKKKFKYSQKILDEFGPIFNSDKKEQSPLRKYSAKIYSIIETIKKSEGIILVYSSYISGGCVPIALALEEIGITRYGDKSKSLFEKPPTPSIGKYVMITGDKQLSPSNKKELKACTDTGNINGEKVKVIIISRAGSEGLDFKNIRQVHILEPWYNMNRADQIIGRAVRNKSHCDLPFSKRNVQIFLYGSQLLNNEVEPIDMYVYRLAEKKSIQIGKITRLLKEISVDCLININQQDLVESKMNKQVELELSIESKKIPFNSGLKNNSIICDFMNCEYNCLPNSSIESRDIVTDSYSQSYIIMNLDKILKRIKTLFKEHYAYDKQELINRVRVRKNYSLEQINMALNVLITDKNEYLVDMLDRIGKLVNIDTLYLFQPIELSNKHISNNERRLPIDIKMQKLNIKLPQDIPDNFANKSKETQNIDILLKLQQDYNKTLIFNEKSKNKNWIEASYWAMKSLETFDDNHFNKTNLERYCLEHLFDILKFNKKVAVLNSLSVENDEITQDFKDKLQIIIDKFTITVKNKDKDDMIGFICANYTSATKKNKKSNKKKILWNILIFDKTLKKWKNSKDLKLIGPIAKKMFEKFRVKSNNCNEYLFGFLTHNRNNTSIIFKLKSNMKGTGLACPTSGENRKDIISRINRLLRELGRETDKYKMKTKTKRQDQTIYDQPIKLNKYEDMDETVKDIPTTDQQLCIETEFILRYLDENKEKYGGKRWFFSTVEDVNSSLKDIEKSN